MIVLGLYCSVIVCCIGLLLGVSMMSLFLMSWGEDDRFIGVFVVLLVVW